ncbi:MAG: aminoglycoside phosphotransferase family protein [Acidobacteriota bacterium]
MLPASITEDDYRVLRRDRDRQRALMTVIAERHGLAPSELGPFEQGWQLVWGTSSAVIKLFEPNSVDDARVETLLLEHLTMLDADLAVPRLEARGELEGWPYLVMSRLAGRRIGDARPSLDATARERLAGRMGEVMASLAALPTHGLEELVITQDALLAERRARLLKDQRDRGGDDLLEEQLRAFLDDPPPLAPAEPVLLHADLTDDHFLLDEDGSLAGVIDLADAFVGPWTYELAAPACFLTFGQPRVLSALLAGCGVTPGPEIQAAIRTWMVMHRYSHVAHHLKASGRASLREWLEAGGDLGSGG